MFARTTGKTCVGKLHGFPYLVLAQIMKGGGKYIVSRFKLAACLHGNC